MMMSRTSFRRKTVKTFSRHILAAAIIGLALSSGIAVAQEQPFASVVRLVPRDITGHYVVPAIKPARNPARYDLLIADPFKEIPADVTPVIAARPLSVACVAALLCP